MPRARKQNNFKQAVIKAIRTTGLEPGVRYLAENLTELEALQKEIELIALYGRRVDGTGILSNLTLGGEGVSGLQHTEETKAKMRKPKKGSPHLMPKSAETREKIAASLRGKPGRGTGYKWTEEQKKKLSDARQNRSGTINGMKRVYREDGSFYFAKPESGIV